MPDPYSSEWEPPPPPARPPPPPPPAPVQQLGEQEQAPKSQSISPEGIEEQVATGQKARNLQIASMPASPDQSARARRHARSWADPEARSRIARRMYAWRLGEVVPDDDITVLRGIEGARAKVVYRTLADQYGVVWRGRRYDRSAPNAADIPNQAINHASVAVIAAAQLAVTATGTLPQLGFIHEGSGMSFALDIADLYRDSMTVPVAFAAAKESLRQPNTPVERIVRKMAGKRFRDEQLVTKMITKIKELFDADDSGCPESSSS